MSENLKILRDLTENLTLARVMPSADIVETEDGRHILLQPLLKTDNIGVLNTILYSDMSIIEHAHAETEIIIAYKGSCEVIVNGSKTVTLNIGDSVTLPPSAIHKVQTKEGACLVCITVPAAPEYPPSPGSNLPPPIPEAPNAKQ